MMKRNGSLGTAIPLVVILPLSLPTLLIVVVVAVDTDGVGQISLQHGLLVGVQLLLLLFVVQQQQPASGVWRAAAAATAAAIGDDGAAEAAVAVGGDVGYVDDSICNIEFVYFLYVIQ